MESMTPRPQSETLRNRDALKELIRVVLEEPGGIEFIHQAMAEASQALVIPIRPSEPTEPTRVRLRKIN